MNDDVVVWRAACSMQLCTCWHNRRKDIWNKIHVAAKIRAMKNPAAAAVTPEKKSKLIICIWI